MSRPLLLRVLPRRPLLYLRCSSTPCILPSHWHHFHATPHTLTNNPIPDSPLDPRSTPTSKNTPSPPPSPPQDHNSAPPPPYPTKEDNAPYWETMSSATTTTPTATTAPSSPPPKEQSPLSGHIESVRICTAPGVQLRSHHQGQVLGGLLDLLAGMPEKDVLAFFREDAEFVNPVVEARGRDEVVAYWYAYRDMFSAVKNRRHEVVKAEGAEVEMDVEREFKFRGGFGKERGFVVKSRVKVRMDDGGNVSKVEDCWEGVMWLPKFLRRLTARVLRRAGRAPAKEAGG